MIRVRYPAALLAGALAQMLLSLTFAVPAAAQDAGANGEALTLQPGDVLQVEIWREEDLSGEFPVDEAGVVTLPMLGEKEVTGIPMREIRDALLAEYRVQLRNPSITITPLKRIHVLGAVRTPGLYEVDPTFSLAGAIGLAGGATRNANLRRIRIIRDGAVIEEGAGGEATLAGVDVRSGDQIYVEERRLVEWQRTIGLVSGITGGLLVLLNFIL